MFPLVRSCPMMLVGANATATPSLRGGRGSNLLFRSRCLPTRADTAPTPAADSLHAVNHMSHLASRDVRPIDSNVYCVVISCCETYQFGQVGHGAVRVRARRLSRTLPVHSRGVESYAAPVFCCRDVDARSAPLQEGDNSSASDTSTWAVAGRITVGGIPRSAMRRLLDIGSGCQAITEVRQGCPAPQTLHGSFDRR